MKELIWEQILSVRQNGPLVHSITNYVVMNNTANALLAAGASPIMAHAHPEMRDMVNIIGALVINIGTLDRYWIESMHLAIEQANLIGKPWVLDPVGAGATPYRNGVLKELLDQRPTVIRGNASEIMALAAHTELPMKGVDSTNESNEAVAAGRLLHELYGSVVCISGATDIVIGNGKQANLSNGHPMMAKVTGLGCSATALIGAFLAVLKEDSMMATISAMGLIGVAGQLAAKNAAGPGSLQLALLDKLYNISEQEFLNTLQYSE